MCDDDEEFRNLFCYYTLIILDIYKRILISKHSLNILLQIIKKKKKLLHKEESNWQGRPKPASSIQKNTKQETHTHTHDG